MPIYISILLITIISSLITLMLSEIIRVIEKRIYKKQNSNIISIIPLSGHVENAEYLIRSSLIEHKNSNKSSIILIDLGMDNETKEICRIMALANSSVIICEKEDLSTIIKKQLEV